LLEEPVVLTRRIIACLDVRDGTVVKGRQFEELAGAGDPSALAKRYNDEGIDELMLLDVSATLEGRGAMIDTIRRVSAELFIPLGVGGGVTSLESASALFDAGADKVSINSAALTRPALIEEIARRYGSQAVIVAIDARKRRRVSFSENDTRRRFSVFGRSGTVFAREDAVEWAKEAAELGAGEILLTSIDRDGTRDGFDCELTAAVSTAVSIPVVASGGAGNAEHFADVFTSGCADAALAASIFHYGELSVATLKRELVRRGIPMREVAPC